MITKKANFVKKRILNEAGQLKNPELFVCGYSHDLLVIFIYLDECGFRIFPATYTYFTPIGFRVANTFYYSAIERQTNHTKAR